MKLTSSKIVTAFFLVYLSSCGSTPKVSQSSVTEAQAKEWFQTYCSKGVHAENGEVVLRANTKEFKGQFPGNIRFEPNGGFTLEVTSLIGGTILRLTSDGNEMATVVPSKPRQNREHITHYLGLDLPILSELLVGDLPCPSSWRTGGVRATGNQMQIITANWRWNFEKADATSGSVPVRILLEPIAQNDPKNKIELLIEDWDQAGHYVKKVSLKSPEGDLKWTWRNRSEH